MYAAYTKVPVQKTKTDIETTLTRYGADRFAYFVEPMKAIIVFEAHARRLRFDLPLQEGASEKDEQKRRQQWRALLLCIKAKLESVASGIESFEEAFLAHVVLPDGQTVGENLKTPLDQIYKEGKVTPLLPDYSGGRK